MSSLPDQSTALPWHQRFGPAIAAVLCLFLFYYRGLDCWFYQDDFGWLSIGPAHNFKDLLTIAFAPKAHGNLRPWSENLYFYVLKAIFGINPLPFRIVVFLTVSANLFLLNAIARRLTGSVWGGATTTFCWLLNPCVAPAFCWTCIYNQPQSLCFILSAFLLFLKGRERAAAIVFVVGLGSLETVVMYPLLVSAYTLLFDRSRFLRTLPLYAGSFAFTLIHFLVAPVYKTGPYAIRIDRRIFHTLATYIEMVVGPERFNHFFWDWPKTLFVVATTILCAAVLLAMMLRDNKREPPSFGNRTAVFGVAWFLILLGPLLLLPDHIMDYTLVGPAVGFALVLGAMVSARKAIGIPIAILYLAFVIPASWHVMRWNWERSHIARDLVQGVLRFKRANPDKTLLLTGMDTDQFWAGFADLPFHAHGYDDVWLAPGAESNIHDNGILAPRMVWTREKSYPLLDSGKAMVLDVAGGQVHDVTAQYQANRPRN
ncbi:hypothetical protein [uncultured Paludibaculum sp.]|uniref:hypothetical protein n=1 Tax=uncultured Paludibaculum sp. TaxID=1765020 RepID=UPI002AAC0A52|nr:hypothetical protein [uncultured Paludibaculum sp.]